MGDIDSEIQELLSKQFFEKSLKSGFEVKNIEIENIEITLAPINGENFSSTIYRVKIEYKFSKEDEKSEYVSLIVKSMDSDTTDSPSQIFDGFNKEVTMYTIIIPKIEKILKKNESFAPKFFYAEHDSNYQNIVIEDLNTSQYLMLDRCKRLDEIHSKAILQKLGRFHAGSFVLLQKESTAFELFNDGFFNDTSFNLKIFQNIYVQSFQQIIQLISHWKGYERITEKLKRIYENFRQKIINTMKPRKNEIRVLNHSDLWTNNVFFKYNTDGEICDIKFIDFQCNCGSLAIDIHYFLATSVDYDVLKTKRRELLTHYFNSFRNTLEELRFSKIPSCDDFMGEIHSKEFCGIIMLFGEAPIAVLDHNASEGFNFDVISDGLALAKKRELVYSKPDYRDYLKFSLKRCDILGVFD